MRFAIDPNVVMCAEQDMLMGRVVSLERQGLTGLFEHEEVGRLLFWAIAAMRGYDCASEDCVTQKLRL